MLSLINGVLGVALLVAGRKLFWLFIGALGFITGIQLTANFWQGPDWMLLIIGVIVGVIFAALATFLQALAIGLAGFLAGGYAFTILAGMLGMETLMPAWIVYIIGGVIGVALVSFLFDWAIITLSSLAGALLVIRTFFSQTDNAQIILAALFILGIIVQGSLLRSEKNRNTRADQRTME